MPTIPTYLDTQNRVALDPEFQRGLTVQADPDAFGAGLGRATEQVASGLDRVAEAARLRQDLTDNAIVSTRLQQYVRSSDDALYNPDNGYMNLEGQQAVQAYDAFKKKVGGLKTSASSGLSPSQLNIFRQKVDGIESNTLGTILKKNAAETKTFVLQEHAASADMYSQQAAKNPLDINSWDNFIFRGVKELQESGEKQGWGPEKIEQAHKAYISNARVAAVQTLALSNPIAAAKYATDHADEIDPQSQLALLETLKPHIADAVSRDAQHFSAANPGPHQFAAGGLPHDTYALLSVISGSESPGYNIMNGGQTVADLARHPGFIGAGGTTTASGRYQFVKGTWETAATALGLADFSPASQDRAAAWLAARDYRTRTGRDLGQDIAAGNYAMVRANLGPTWQGLAKMSDAKFAEKMGQARSAPILIGNAVIPAGTPAPIAAGSTGNASTSAGNAPALGPQFSPETAAVLDRLPQAYADDIRTAAGNGMKAYTATMTAQQKAIQTAQTDSYKLRIANGDTTLTVADLNDDTVIDNGDKAVLISALKESQKGVLETESDVAAFQAGNFKIDAYSDRDHKRNDNVWRAISADVPNDQRKPILLAQVWQTGVIPSSVVSNMRKDLSSGNTSAVAGVLDLASKISAVDPGALLRATGGNEIADDTAMYSHYVNDMGFTPFVAAKKIIDSKDSEKVKANAALLESKPVKDKFKNQVTDANVRAIFSTGRFTRNPALGTSLGQSAAIVSDYGGFLNQALYEKDNFSDAVALANDRFKRIYGVTDYARGGQKIVTRLPPEKTYPSDHKGSWGYIGEQMKAALAVDGIEGRELFLMSDRNTQADFVEGKPARYQLFYTDENGIHQQYRRTFTATVPKDEEMEAAKKAEAERKAVEDEAKKADIAKKNAENAAKQIENQKEQKELDARRDSELDDFLAGPPKLQTPLVRYSN